jgi:hypothetical protein
MWGTLLTSVFGGVSAWITGWQQRVTMRAESEARIEEAKTAAQIRYLNNAQQAEIDWDNAAVGQMEHSWKDEFWTLLLAIPLVLCFFGAWGEGIVTQGFKALESMPDWYQMAIGVSIAASFGYRKLVDFMARWRGQG